MRPMRFILGLTRPLRAVVSVAVCAALALALSACGDIGYGLQALRGHSEILANRVPLAQALADPDVPAPIKAQIRLSQSVLAFAEDQGLNVGPNYRHYAKTNARAVVYNVFATPEFDLAPIENCFPVIGCVAYRGFYDVAEAQAHQAELSAQGNDTVVFPIGAYSTLGLTADPLTTAILSRSPNDVVRTLIHESVHATLFLGGDTGFDESMAEAVAETLSIRFWQTQGQALARTLDIDIDQILARDAKREQAARAVSAAAAAMKQSLNAVYDAPDVPDAARRAQKARLFTQFRRWQAQNRDSLSPYTYDALFAQDMNNAHMLAFSLYDDLKPKLRSILDGPFGGDAAAFLGWAKTTQGLTPAERRQEADKIWQEIPAQTTSAQSQSAISSIRFPVPR